MKSIKNNPQRRQFLVTAGATVAAIPVSALVGTRVAYSADMVDVSSAQAMALKYIEVSATDGQLCSNCALYQVVEGEDKAGTCPLFQGVLVGGDAWCSAWAAMG